MHVSLTQALEKYVKDQVETGLYNNASEVIREALRLKRQVEEFEAAKLEALRRDIDSGWQQAERGELVEFDRERFLSELDQKTGVKR